MNIARRARLELGFAAVLSTMGLAASASAQAKPVPLAHAITEEQPTKSDPSALPAHRVWYGKQIITPVLIADGLGAIVYVVTVASHENDLQPLLGYPILMARSAVGPIVHWAHGHILRGFGSLALNAALPFVGVLDAIAVTDRCGDYEPYECFEDGVALGAVMGILGGIGATIIETSLFSYDDPKPNTTARAPSFTLSVMPTFAPKQVGIVLGGQF